MHYGCPFGSNLRNESLDKAAFPDSCFPDNERGLKALRVKASLPAGFEELELPASADKREIAVVERLGRRCLWTVCRDGIEHRPWTSVNAE